MLNRLLFRLTANRPCRLIKLNDRPYLERYFVGQLLGVTFYLHRFVSDDSERHLHNHPWTRSLSLILCGSYVEEHVVDFCPHAGSSGCVTRRDLRRWWNWVPGNLLHRIHDAKPGTWSLFMHGQRARVNHGMTSSLKGWGFIESLYVVGLHDVTVFKTYHGSGDLTWWKTAPVGQWVGREPLL